MSSSQRAQSGLVLTRARTADVEVVVEIRRGVEAMRRWRVGAEVARPGAEELQLHAPSLYRAAAAAALFLFVDVANVARGRAEARQHEEDVIGGGGRGRLARALARHHDDFGWAPPSRGRPRVFAHADGKACFSRALWAARSRASRIENSSLSRGAITSAPVCPGDPSGNALFPRDGGGHGPGGAREYPRAKALLQATGAYGRLKGRRVALLPGRQGRGIGEHGAFELQDGKRIPASPGQPPAYLHGEPKMSRDDFPRFERLFGGQVPSSS